MTIQTRMCDLPQLWDEYDESKFFTVGRGKKEYHIWTCGPCGLHYCYHIAEHGYLSCKRAVEPTAIVHLHIIEK